MKRTHALTFTATHNNYSSVPAALLLFPSLAKILNQTPIRGLTVPYVHRTKGYRQNDNFIYILMKFAENIWCTEATVHARMNATEAGGKQERPGDGEAGRGNRE